MDISEIIKGLLEKREMSQADICRLTGIPTSLMSNYIKGTKSPSLSNSIKLSQAFGITMDELAGIKQEFTTPKMYSSDTIEVATVYEMADSRTKNKVRCILDMELIREDLEPERETS